MQTFTPGSRKELLAQIEQLQEGDCIQISCLADVAGKAKEMLSLLQRITDRGADFISLREGIDTRGEQKAGVLVLCHALASLEHMERREKQQKGIDRAKEEGKYKGRKPITVNDELFETVVESWQNGQITAREAMAQLELKPNTFYRRIKAREAQKKKDYRKAGQGLRSEEKKAARQTRHELDALKKQIRAEAREMKKLTSDQ